MNIRIINTPECLCRTCKLYGCEDCPRGKAEEEVMHIKQAMSAEKISRVIEMFTMQEMYGTEIAKAIHKLIGK